MKRVFFGVLVLLVLMAFVPVYSYVGGDAEDIYTFTIDNPTPQSITTIINVNTIRPSVDKVVGFGIQPVAGVYLGENVIALYDATTSDLAGEQMGETESSRETGILEWFPYPRKVLNGVVVRQGAWTSAVVYFIKR